MKRFLSVLLSITIIFTMCFVVNASDTLTENEPVASENVRESDGYYYTLQNNKATIVGIDPEFKSTYNKRYVPSTLNKQYQFIVVAIGNYAYENTDMIDEIFIPDTVETIGEGAFKDSSIKSVEFGYNVKSIGKDAFAGCDIESVLFKGTEKQFQNVQVGEGNEKLLEKITFSTKLQVTQRRLSSLQTKAGENIELMFLSLGTVLVIPAILFVFPPGAIVGVAAPITVVYNSFEIVAEFFEIISDYLFRI